jgi:hypothetical protein
LHGMSPFRSCSDKARDARRIQGAGALPAGFGAGVAEEAAERPSPSVFLLPPPLPDPGPGSFGPPSLSRPLPPRRRPPLFSLSLSCGWLEATLDALALVPGFSRVASAPPGAGFAVAGADEVEAGVEGLEAACFPFAGGTPLLPAVDSFSLRSRTCTFALATATGLAVTALTRPS